MPKLQPVRGTHDILPEETRLRRFIEAMLARVCTAYGYGEISTPIFEFSEVFLRTLGDTSDVVTKETYTFVDRGNESITLRPEFTAAVVRAFISNGLQERLPFKAYYTGPAFRYERPQKGRLRQFHQFGAELLGEAGALADAELIAMAQQGLAALGLQEHVTLELNSLGDKDSRQAYRSALVEYCRDHRDDLSEDSRARLERNPLRILDSKDEGDKRLMQQAPTLHAHFTPLAADFFAQLQEALAVLEIPFIINERLVRGLDYYAHTVFEFTTTELGAQGTVLGGGRYDGLVSLMGGPDTPGVGFAAGIERLLALMEVSGANALVTPPVKPIAIIPIDEAQALEALKLAQALRAQGFIIELITRGNMSKKMKRADKLGAQLALMLGESEVASGQAMVKNLADGSQQLLEIGQLPQRLLSFI